MSKTSFIEYFMNQEVKFEPLMEAKYIVMSMLGLRSDGTPAEEFKAIQAYLGQKGLDKIDLEKYIKENLDKEDTFYIVEKDFWDNWNKNTCDSEKDKMQPKDERKMLIDNRKLIEKNH